jgi:hypothetical protein
MGGGEIDSSRMMNELSDDSEDQSVVNIGGIKLTK